MKSFAFVLVIVLCCWHSLVLEPVQSQEEEEREEREGDQLRRSCPADCPAPEGGRQWPPEGFTTDEAFLQCSFRCSARNDTEVGERESEREREREREREIL